MPFLSSHSQVNREVRLAVVFCGCHIFYIKLHIWWQINMNAFWCGTHWWTGGSGDTAAPPPRPPMLFPSSSTREMAFVLAQSIVHHSGTKRLNQVAWSNSPWGFNATETRDYSLTVPVLQRTLLWHSTVCKPFSNGFPRCKTGPAPWDFSLWWRKDTGI